MPKFNLDDLNKVGKVNISATQLRSLADKIEQTRKTCGNVDVVLYTTKEDPPNLAFSIKEAEPVVPEEKVEVPVKKEEPKVIPEVKPPVVPEVVPEVKTPDVVVPEENVVQKPGAPVTPEAAPVVPVTPEPTVASPTVAQEPVKKVADVDPEREAKLAAMAKEIDNKAQPTNKEEQK